MLRSGLRTSNITNSFIRSCSKRSTNLNTNQKTNETTIDKAEINHFVNYTEEWWNENGKLKPLHSMNRIRIPFIRDGILNTGVNKELEHAPKPLLNLDILDVGCGGGVLTEGLARLGAQVTGLDAGKELVQCAQEHARKDKDIVSNIHYIHSSIEEYSGCEDNINKFDAVVASEVIEHVNSHEVFVQHCCEVLKPGGSIFFTTMNKTYLAWLGGIIAAEDVLKIVPRGTHEYEKFIAPHRLQKLLELNNCATKSVHGMFYNFLFNTWHWFPDMSINYALHAVKLRKVK